MAGTYVEGGADLIDALGGGFLDDSTKDWFAQQSQMVSQTLGQAGQAFFGRAREMYQTVSESQALQMLRNLRSRNEDVWSANMIQPLRTLESLQTAGPIMQRWVMGQPDLRTRYLNQEVEGYGDSYVNYHGDTVGVNHYDYRKVMNAMVVIPEDDDKDWVCRNFFEYVDDDRELTVHERLDVLDTWDVVKRYLEEGGEDPTSPYGNLL